MFSTKLDPHIFLIDLKPAGFSHFIASYVLKAKKTAIIETGPTATIPNLLAGLREIEVDAKDVDYVAVSHIHLDHGGGAGTLLSHLPKAKLIVHKRGAPHIADPARLWSQSKQVLGKVAELYEEPVSVIKERIIVAKDRMTVDLGEGVELKAIETLGHASHHQSFYEKRSKGVFPGDTAGIYIPEFKTITPTTPPPFHLETALASIEKLKQLKPKLLYYSHFGRATDALEKLQTHADQLRLWANVVAEKMKEGATIEEIKEEIANRDSEVHKVKSYIKTHPIMGRGTFSQNIQGFIEYFKYKERQH
ncbi:MAG: MBL fold metallo-hydrolase [Candidatus Bathyarchaeota archaeon]|nr:MBL fold metallo-hydrolase [Candidatus Bathyarchaeota archaeon]